MKKRLLSAAVITPPVLSRSRVEENENFLLHGERKFVNSL